MIQSNPSSLGGGGGSLLKILNKNLSEQRNDVTKIRQYLTLTCKTPMPKLLFIIQSKTFYTGGDGPYARRSTYATSIDVRFSAIFHGLMAVIKAYFLVAKSII